MGKSTLFNALLKRQAAFVASYPFATIEPNVGIVPVQDERLHRLASSFAPQKCGATEGYPTSSRLRRGTAEKKQDFKDNVLPKVVPATVKFVDIAGLVAGAHKGEGLGNQFLAHIRECDLICHVLRGFEDSNVAKAGSVNPAEDLKTVRTELMLKDLETIEKIKNEKLKMKNCNSKLKIIVDRIYKRLSNGEMLNKLNFSEEEKDLIRDLFLLTVKPEIAALNVGEDKLSKGEFDISLPDISTGDVIVLSAKLESELGSLSEEDQRLYLKELGIKGSALERLVKRAYKKLGLISFFTTTGGHEVRSWSIKKGTPAIEAAGIIHSDFRDKFIKTKVIDWKNFVKFGGWTKAKEAGKIRFEGKDYKIKEGEVVEIAIRR